MVGDYYFGVGGGYFFGDGFVDVFGGVGDQGDFVFQIEEFVYCCFFGIVFIGSGLVLVW